jgi:DNA replication initiation complex subunit (GINS family)
MLNYNDLYEILRKEKYNEGLQLLPSGFVKDYSDFVSEMKESASRESDMFSDSAGKIRKQMENSVAIFKELMLRRKKKLLSLVFVAAETGIMKRDYENMLTFERDVFERVAKAFEEGDKELAKQLGRESKSANNRMIIFTQGVEQFVDMFGNVVGPFASGELANLDAAVSEVLVSGGKANFVDG